MRFAGTELARPFKLGLVRLAGVAVFFVIGIFGYGYWHAATHGTVYLDLRDRSGGSVRPPSANVTLRDQRGLPLAEFATDDARYVFLTGAYSCREIEKRAAFQVGGREEYARCFERQSRWVAQWARDVTQADVSIGGCRWKAVPVEISQLFGPSEWLLWWVPTPHGGGLPYAEFQARMTIDLGVCTA